MRIIDKIYIEKFRAFKETEINFGRPVNAIIGKNGTMKTTLLGLLAHPFSLKTGVMSGEEPLIGGKNFNSPMGDKFKFSDVYDIPGEHKWSLYINKQVYEKEVYTCVSERRTDTGKIRFWSTEGRQQGMNYIQCPVVYLSLKRLLPLGEESQLNIRDTELTKEEKKFYIEEYNKILISIDNIKEVSSVQANTKLLSLGPVTGYSDAWTISAGQDNIGRVILAVLSMKRLMDKYGEDYKGGIICIDEVESTLYPAAQEKLLEFMYETAVKFKLQYFFTTHSLTIIKQMKVGKYSDRGKLIYLQKVGDKINVMENPSLLDIKNDLNVEAGREKGDTKIKVYCEDDIGVMFCKAFLEKSMKDKVNFVTKMDLSWTSYRTCYQHKVPEFLNNIIVLDGDVTNPNQGWKNYPKDKNIAFLPTQMAPEKMIYEMLFNMDIEDEFWDNSLSGYSKEKCFRNYPNHLEKIDDIKDWFSEQRGNAGRAYSKFLNEWKKRNVQELQRFRNNFIEAYQYVAKRVGI